MGSDILNAEIVIAKCFVDVWPEKEISAKFGTGRIRETTRGTGFRKKSIGAARKNLNVLSVYAGGEYRWVWENDKTPREVWKLKCDLFWEEINREREGH